MVSSTATRSSRRRHDVAFSTTSLAAMVGEQRPVLTQQRARFVAEAERADERVARPQLRAAGAARRRHEQADVVDDEQRQVHAETAHGVGPGGGAHGSHRVVRAHVAEREGADLAGEVAVAFVGGDHGSYFSFERRDR